MDHLLSYSRMRGKEIEVESFLLENTFDLIMQGKKSEYIQSVSKGLINIIEENPKKSVVAAQLSMLPAAQLTEKKRDIPVGNHLESLSICDSIHFIFYGDWNGSLYVSLWIGSCLLF